MNFTLSSAFKTFVILLNLNFDAIIVLFLFTAFELPSVKILRHFLDRSLYQIIIVPSFVSVNFTLSSAFKTFVILLNLNFDAIIVYFIYSF